MSEAKAASRPQPVPAGPMPESLDAAKAAFQAHLPRITKGETADVPGKEGKRGYSYQYADLADVSQAVLPLLGSLGMAFTSSPTTNDKGEFVLLWKLSHVSGEKEEGEWPLPSPRNTNPQLVGSAITYARRYSLQCATGVHPDGEDDDAGSVTAAATSAGDAWQNATPARPHGNGSGHAPRAQDPPRREPTVDDLDPDAQQFADEAYAATSLAALDEVKVRTREAHKLDAIIRSPGNGRICGLGHLMAWKRDQLKEVEDALAALHTAAGKVRVDVKDLDQHVKKVTGQPIEGATAAQLRQAAAALAKPPADGQVPPTAEPAAAPPPPENTEWALAFLADVDDAKSAGALSGLQGRLGPAIANRTITSDTASELASAVGKKRRELQGAGV